MGKTCAIVGCNGKPYVILKETLAKSHNLRILLCKKHYYLWKKSKDVDIEIEILD